MHYLRSIPLYYKHTKPNPYQVEYLLFECLQDLTGGNICFYLASYSYMVDITTPEDRTRRMSILDSALPAGLVLGLPVGSYVRNTYGLVPLYSLATGVTLLAMVYVLLVVKESRGGGEEGRIQEVQDNKPGLAFNKGNHYCLSFMSLIVQRTMVNARKAVT